MRTTATTRSPTPSPTPTRPVAIVTTGTTTVATGTEILRRRTHPRVRVVRSILIRSRASGELWASPTYETHSTHALEREPPHTHTHHHHHSETTRGRAHTHTLPNVLTRTRTHHCYLPSWVQATVGKQVTSTAMVIVTYNALLHGMAPLG